MIYVASPYTHPDPAIRQERYEQVRDFCARVQPMFNDPLYSPIVHWHDAAVCNEMPTEAEFWWRHNSQMLDLSKMLIVYAIEGYGDSVGVTQEVNYAMDKGLKLEYYNPSEI